MIDSHAAVDPCKENQTGWFELPFHPGKLVPALRNRCDINLCLHLRKSGTMTDILDLKHGNESMPPGFQAQPDRKLPWQHKESCH